MSKIETKGVIVIIDGIENLQADLNNLESACREAVVKSVQELEAEWRQNIIGLNAIETGNFVRSIGTHKGATRDFVNGGGRDTHSFVLDTSNDSSVNYSLLSEEGVKSRNYEGKPALKMALEGLELRQWMESNFDKEISKALKHADRK